MSQSAQDSLLRSYTALFREFQKDPALVADAGFIKIVSANECDRDGNMVRRQSSDIDKYRNASANDEPSAPSGFIKPYRRNHIQRIFAELRELSRKNKRPFRIVFLKSRGVGASVEGMTFIASAICVDSGVRALVTAKSPKNTGEIYRIARDTIAGFPKWLADPSKFPANSKDLVEARNELFGISQSHMACLASSNIDSVRGMRFLHLFKDEGAYADKPKDFSKATNSLLLDDPRATECDVSTGNGEDGYFDQMFLDAYSAQQGNPWEKGARLFYGPRLALFCPFYFDRDKTIHERPDGLLHKMGSDCVTYESLSQDLDDLEKEILATGLLRTWEGYGYSEAEAMKASLRQLYWRRCKIDSEYTYFLKAIPKGGTLNSLNSFRQEEPATVEDAFNSMAGEFVIPGHVRDSMREQFIKPPVKVGEMCGQNFIPRPAEEREQEQVWIWKEPHEVKGQMVLSLDPSGGTSEGESGRWNYDLDFTWANLWEVHPNGDFEQIAEFVSQNPAYISAPQLLGLLVMYKNESNNEFAMPFVVSESQFGQNMLHMLQDHAEYRHRPHLIYKHKSDSRVGRESGGMRLGLFMSAPIKGNAVRYMADRICGKRMIIRSRRILRQLGHFINHGNNKFGASRKRGGGPSSKDDGVIACAIAAYADETGVIPSSMASVSGLDGKSKYVFSCKPDDAASVQEKIKFMMDARAQGIDTTDLPTESEYNYCGGKIVEPWRLNG